MYFPDFDTFRSLAGQGNLIPVCREIMADMDTPVSAFRKIDDGPYSFLLESIEGGEKWGRYSFLGANPATVIRTRGTTVEIVTNGEVRAVTSDDPLGFMREYLSRFNPVEIPGLPRFFGGAVGYLGYDMVRHFERLTTEKPAIIGAWDSCFVITDTILIFDTMRQKITVVSNAHLEDGQAPEAAYAEAIARVDALIAKLRTPLSMEPAAPAVRTVSFASNVTREAFEAAVEKCKEYVRAGDIIQVVLSQRFSGELTMEPLSIYRVLRTLNPSPYMFFLRLDDALVVGASPEVMVRKEGDRVELRPIAGTRPRG
ncbi:anthranilate synthase component I, partial [bacterium]|nr:anthranilate synthase component I [bacterium]